jgi:hypothetical protein
LFQKLHARLRAHQAPGIPCALCFQKAGREEQNPDELRRGNAKVCFSVIACDKREAFAQWSVSDEAIQLSAGTAQS